MARIRGTVSTVTEVAYSVAAVWKTILAIKAATNHVVVIKGFSVAFDGTSVISQPVLVKLERFATIGTGTDINAATGANEGLVEETVFGATLTTFVSACKNNSGEPSTSGGVVRVYNVHPQTGIEVRFNPDDEIVLNQTALAIKLYHPTDNTLNATAHFSFEA